MECAEHNNMNRTDITTTDQNSSDCYDLETFLKNDNATANAQLSCCVQYSTKTMDNAAFEQDTRGTEMRDVTITLDKTRIKGDGTVNGHPASTSAGTTCHPEACLAARKKYLAQGPQSADQSPWHKRKTIYLLTVITLLIIWVIVYSSLHIHGVL